MNGPRAVPAPGRARRAGVYQPACAASTAFLRKARARWSIQPGAAIRSSKILDRHPAGERRLPPVVPAGRERTRLADHRTLLFGFGLGGPHRRVHGAATPARVPADAAEERPELRRERLVQWHELGRGRPVHEQAAQVEDPAELADRVGMVVDPEVDPAIVAAAVAGTLAHDEEGRGLAAAPVAPGGVGGGQAGHEQLGERPAAGQVRLGERVDDTGPRQDVALGRVPVARPAPGPREAAPAGMGGRSAMRIDDARLALLPERVGPDERRQGVRRARPALEEGQAVGPVGDVRERLGGDRADAGPRPRHARPHGEELGLDRHGEIAGRRVARDDRERHPPVLLCTADAWFPGARPRRAACATPAMSSSVILAALPDIGTPSSADED